ncbi:MAG: hypothetical protein ABSC33_12770 [Candidatus Sulfotelmatobacter sp.]
MARTECAGIFVSSQSAILMEIETDGTAHAKERDVVILNLLVQSSGGNTKQPSQFFNRESLLAEA